MKVLTVATTIIRILTLHRHRAGIDQLASEVLLHPKTYEDRSVAHHGQNTGSGHHCRLSSPTPSTPFPFLGQRE